MAWARADLLEGLPDAHDAIVANPPYVESAQIERLEPEIARHEPRLALDGGPDGLDALRRLIAQASRTSAATLILEHGEGQEDAVAALCRAGGFASVTSHRDLAQVARAVLARR